MPDKERRPRWNAEAQRWESGPPPLPYAPPPPLPQYAPRPVDGVPPEPVSPDDEVAVIGTPPDDAGARTGAGRWTVRSRRGALVAAGAVVLLGAGVTVWVVGGDDRPATAGTGGGQPTTSVGPPTTGTPSDLAEPTETSSVDNPPMDDDDGTVHDDGVPAGFHVTTDPDGFTLAVPDDWRRSKQSTGVFYRSADGTSLLQVFTVVEKELTPEKAVEGASRQLGANPGYDELDVGPVSGGAENPNGDAAELTYSYDSAATGGRREGIERVFTSTSGEKYALLVAAPGDATPFQRQALDTALAHFIPAP